MEKIVVVYCYRTSTKPPYDADSGFMDILESFTVFNERWITHKLYVVSNITANGFLTIHLIFDPIELLIISEDCSFVH